MVQANKVGFEGIKGSHSEEAVLQLFKSQPAFSSQSPQPSGFSTFHQVFKAVLNGTVDFGLVPIENSIAGSFFPVVDLIMSSKLHIVGEFEQEERHILAALPGTKLEDVKEVHSHPYSFDQCRPFLGTLEGKKLVQSLDTASSCEEIQRNKLAGIAAIASAKAASLYSLQVIHEIDTPAVTRYALVSKSLVVPERHLNPRTSVQVVLKNQVGAMLKAVTAFSLRDISIAKIESRPSSRSIKLLTPWEYVVYIDLEAGTNDDRLKNALLNLQEFATVTVLGSYPRFQQPAECNKTSGDSFSSEKMSDPESPSFHRKPFSVETNRFDDANYWRLPIDELDFKESASLSTMGRDFQAMDSEIGVNGTLRGIKRPNKPSVEILKTSLPRIIEIGRAKPIIPAKRHIIPVYEPIIPKFDNSVQKDSQFESKGVLVVDTAADTSTPTPIPSFEDAIDNHKYRLFDYPAVTESIVVVESNTIEQVPKQNSFRSFEARDAYDRRPYRLFDEHDRDAIISIPPRPADHLRISPKLPAEGPRSVLSSESISSIPRKSEFKPQPVIRDKLLSPVTSNTTLGSETGRESIATKKSTKAPKFDKEDLDYNKSNENLKKRFWFKWIMFWRSLIMTVHTWWTVYPGLDNPIVVSLGAKGLLITILLFSTLDLILAIIKAWPNRFWIFWKVREWNPVKQLGNVWAILADHELLLSLVPLLANLSLRVYSYRLTELVQDPTALNSITDSDFTFSDWASPEYHNLVQMILWGVSICATMLFNTGMRMKFFIVRYASVSLGLLIGIKALLLLLDMVTTSLFLYTFLVSLGIDLFGSSPDIPLMLAIMICSPVISTICNSFINLPLLYAFKRIKGKKTAYEVAIDCANNLFSVRTTLMSVFAVFYIAVTGYLLNQLKLISADDATSPADVLCLVQWTPQQIVVSLVIVNLTANYLIGVAFNLVYWAIRLSLYLIPGLFG